MLEALFAASIVIAAVAVLRLRLTTFIFAANQLLVLRSLRNIQEFGQPITQAMIPADVFASGNVDVAAQIMAIPTVLLGVSVFAPSRSNDEQKSLPRVPHWLLTLGAIQAASILLSSRTIFSTGYAEDQVLFENVLGGGVQILAFGLWIYAAYRLIVAGRLSGNFAFAGLLVALVATDYSKGSTGLATGIALTGAALFHSTGPSHRIRLRRLFTAVVVVLAVAVVVRGVRSTLHDEGIRAIPTLAERMSANERDAVGRGEGAEQIGNGTQYAAHLLECIALYESGFSRNWRSIYAPIEYTFKPSFLVRMLELERSKEAAWELSEYFIHGGGIYLWGELYWNGGFLCLFVVGAVLVWFSFMCDTRFRTRTVWLVFFLQFAPGLFQGVGYGFAQVSRGFFNGVILLVLIKAFGRNESSRSVPSGAGRSELGYSRPSPSGSA